MSYYMDTIDYEKSGLHETFEMNIESMQMPL